MVFIPVHDSNARQWIKYHYVTVGLVAANVIIFLFETSLDSSSMRQIVLGFGMIPSVVTGQNTLSPELIGAPGPVTMITSQFLHGGWMHLIGNMLFLWVFGDNVEDAMGHARFLLFYLLCGIAANLLQIASDPGSTTPTIGASGAVAGILGAYLMLYPKVRILVVVMWIIPLRLPSYIVLGIWVGLQVLNALSPGESNVAWWAHIGGLAAGAGLIRYFKLPHVSLFSESRNGEVGITGVKMRQKKNTNEPKPPARKNSPWDR